MKGHQRPPWALVLLLVAVSLSSCTDVPGVYVYETSRDRQSGATATFDPKVYVEGIWSSRIVPTVHDQAVDVVTVSAAVADDPAAAGARFGHQSGTGSPYAYLVKGTGTVTKADPTAATGPVTVEVPAPGGKPVTVTVVTGPVIAGTALRDAVGFIAFGDFTNQIAYAEVANQINAKVRADVAATVDAEDLLGKTLTFYGAYSDLVPDQITVVPTELRVGS
ncbi:DUF2291 domain-containing protein [Micromonospora sp. BQ11]|uniref:DUF2291 domain-containing protein n=1 Tax=Micromonospora sp. BQ11 TaxID=3452212 RepID=UPI003F8CEE95